MPVMNIATTCTKAVATTHIRISFTRETASEPPARPKLLTRLEDEGARDLDIPAIARGFDALCRADERADDERGGLADVVEGAKLDSHGGGTRDR